MFIIFFLLFALSGCSWVQGLWPRSEAPLSSSLSHTDNIPDPVPGVWRVEADHQQELAEALHHKPFLVVPIMDVLVDGELLPDYIRTAKLYDSFKRSGLTLARAELSLKWHYQLIAAVEETCPENAIDPLPSCSRKDWLPTWLSDNNGPFYSRDPIAHFLNKYDIDYLIVPDPAIYSGNTVLSLRYAPSSSPIVTLNRKEREELLAPLGENVSLAVMKVERNWLGNVVGWEYELAICQQPLPVPGSSVESLMQVRPASLDKLRDYCIMGLAGLLR